jgi:hypothetical protein
MQVDRSPDTFRHSLPSIYVRMQHAALKLYSVIVITNFAGSVVFSAEVV